MTLAIESALDLESPKPGIYPGVSFADYQKIPAMNCSTLAWGRASMWHLKSVIDGQLERTDTPALGFGRALHIRLLEPDAYATRVIVKGACGTVLKSGDRKGEKCGKPGVGKVGDAWFCGVHGGDDAALDAEFEYISAGDADRIEKAAAALKERKIDNLRRARGQFEVVAVAELMGVLCKARLDKWIPTPAAIVDVKKVAAPKSPDDVRVTEAGFIGRIKSMGYGMAAAFYSDIMHELTEQLPRWYWLVIEDGEPYTPAVFRASVRCLAAGRNEYRSLLQRYKNCLASGVWPGPSDEPVEIDGPSHWLKENGE